ncbi:MAG: DUF1405 domain-containing protein [bacterium]|nr:DUF1405 domain-containing protein [bacterium]
MNLLKLRDRLGQDRRLLVLLLGVNLIGAGYGFDWYADQLRTTPFWLWPLTADSPVSLLFFSLALAMWLAGRRLAVLETLGYVGLVKYGFWTMFVVGLHWARGGDFLGIDLFLFLSHGLMALQALLLAGWLPLPAAAFGPALAWHLANDYFDYLHPGTPTMGLLIDAGVTQVVSLLSTPVATLVLLTLRGRGQQGHDLTDPPVVGYNDRNRIDPSVTPDRSPER